MLVIALMAALGHEDELAMHIRATRNTGATPEDVKEVLLMVAVYAGVPAANTAIRVAKEVYADMRGRADDGASRRVPRRAIARSTRPPTSRTTRPAWRARRASR